MSHALQVAFEKSWSTRRTMSTQQWAQLQAAVAHVGDPHLITAQACFDLARTLGIEYENVGGWGAGAGARKGGYSFFLVGGSP
mgnify:CR=1 FL=1